MDESLGPRWPACLASGFGGYPHDHLIGYYDLIEGAYWWDPASVEVLTVRS